MVIIPNNMGNVVKIMFSIISLKKLGTALIFVWIQNFCKIGINKYILSVLVLINQQIFSWIFVVF